MGEGSRSYRYGSLKKHQWRDAHTFAWSGVKKQSAYMIMLSYHIISYHIISYHIISYQYIIRHILSYPIILDGIVSHQSIARQITTDKSNQIEL